MGFVGGYRQVSSTTKMLSCGRYRLRKRDRDESLPIQEVARPERPSPLLQMITLDSSRSVNFPVEPKRHALLHGKADEMP